MEVPFGNFRRKIKSLVRKRQAKSMPRRFMGIARNARPDDLKSILAFFEAAVDPNVLPRPAADYRRAVDSGLFYIVEVDNQLAAAAGVFFLTEHDRSPLEMGSCFVAPDWRGFALQRLLVRLRIAASVILLDVDAKIYTAVKPKNEASKASILGGGFEPLDHDEPLLIEPCGSCQFRPAKSTGRICCCDFYHISRRNQCEAIRLLLHSDTVSAFHKRGAMDESW